MKNSNCIRKASLITFILITIFQIGFSQKNQISVTPLKPVFDMFDLQYERNIKKRFSIATRVQFWFVNKDENSFALFKLGDSKFNRTNTGIRLGLQSKYALLQGTKTNSSYKFYIASELFVGRHRLQHTKNAYQRFIEEKDGFFETTIPARVISEGAKHGDLNFTSYGISAGIGWQFRFKSITLDLGFMTGNAWINKGVDRLELIPENKEDDPSFTKIGYLLKGKFVEPHLNIGFAF